MKLHQMHRTRLRPGCSTTTEVEGVEEVFLHVVGILAEYRSGSLSLRYSRGKSLAATFESAGRSYEWSIAADDVDEDVQLLNRLLLLLYYYGCDPYDPQGSRGNNFHGYEDELGKAARDLGLEAMPRIVAGDLLWKHHRGTIVYALHCAFNLLIDYPACLSYEPNEFAMACLLGEPMTI